MCFFLFIQLAQMKLTARQRRQQQQQQQQQQELEQEQEQEQHQEEDDDHVQFEMPAAKKRKNKSKKKCDNPIKKARQDLGETIDEPLQNDDSGFQSTLGESIYEDFDDPRNF